MTYMTYETSPFGNPVVAHAFEKDGEIFPPTERTCENCSYSQDFEESGGESVYCPESIQLKDISDFCSLHNLDESNLPDEVREEIDRLRESGEDITSGIEFTQKELESIKRYGDPEAYRENKNEE